MLEIFRALVEEAQAKGKFRQDADTGEIVDLVMWPYLISRFQWQGIEGCSQELCTEKLKRLFYLALRGVLTSG